jgi:hypothetical protein
MIKNCRRIVNPVKLFLTIVLFAAPIMAEKSVVTSAIDDSGSGSFSSIFGKTVPGDTILFSIPGKDTIILKYAKTIEKDLTIFGLNKATGNRIVLQLDTPKVTGGRVFTIRGGNVVLKDFVMRGGEMRSGGVVYITGIDTKVLLENDVIQDGYAYDNDKAGNDTICGGGIYNVNSVVRINNCLIKDNEAYQYRMCCFASSYGGGIYNNAGTMTIENSILRDNSSYASTNSSSFYTSQGSAGGGIANKQGPLEISNSVVLNNSAISAGGGIYSECGIKITNCVIDSNRAGGVFVQSIHRKATVISESSINGIVNNGNTSMSIINCTISNSNGVESNGPLTVVNSTITRNRRGCNGRGGGAALLCNGASDTYYGLVNCTIINNFSENCEVGGIYCSYGHCHFVNTVVVNDSAQLINAPKIESDYFPDSGKAINCFFGKGSPMDQKNCDTNLAIVHLFNTAAPVLAAYGGPTKTISLGSPASLAVGAGVRAGTYSEANSTFGDTTLKIAYFDGAKWVSLETDSIVAPELSITEINTDQRGILRANPPCIGAFEFSSSDATKRRMPIVNGPYQAIWLIGNSLRLFFQWDTKAEIELFSLAGRKMYSHSTTIKHGISDMALPISARGPLICRVTTAQGRIVRTLIKN